MIFSRLVVFMSSSVPSRLGIALKNQMWTTGAASSMWPMRLRRTREGVTLTPQRSENALAEQAIFLGAVRAIVDRFGFLDLAERPAANIVRAGQANAHCAVVI